MGFGMAAGVSTATVTQHITERVPHGHCGKICVLE